MVSPMLEPIVPDVWVQARPLRFFGVETGTRMTVMRLADGGLFVHSPIPLRDGSRDRWELFERRTASGRRC